MNKIFFAICIFLLLPVANAQAEGVYRWIDKDGKVQYGDRPEKDAVGAQKKKFSAPVSAGDDDLPYSIRKAKNDFPVTLYVMISCTENCAKARTFLNDRGVPFTEKNIVTQEEFTHFKNVVGGTMTPTLMVGKTKLSGFEAGQWNSELDIAGYPKVAPYKPKSVPVVAKPVAPMEAEK